MEIVFDYENGTKTSIWAVETDNTVEMNEILDFHNIIFKKYERNLRYVYIVYSETDYLTANSIVRLTT